MLNLTVSTILAQMKPQARLCHHPQMFAYFSPFPPCYCYNTQKMHSEVSIPLQFDLFLLICLGRRLYYFVNHNILNGVATVTPVMG